jgi:hypothetical protein
MATATQRPDWRGHAQGRFRLCMRAVKVVGIGCVPGEANRGVDINHLDCVVIALLPDGNTERPAFVRYRCQPWWNAVTVVCVCVCVCV